jgi:Abnormal spindle-like microcephaly-assoc'd, ASPM-SPD-2-Hydin
MCRLIRVLLVSVPVLFVFLVAPSAFAQSWISAVTAIKTTTTATITWITAVPANSQITYGTTTNYGSSSALNSNLVTTHSVTLTSLTSGTTYHYRVLSADSTGVLVTGPDNVFTTPSAAISVSVSPTTATVASGATQQFSAQLTNTSNTAVIWSTTSGSVTTTGLFTAPSVTAAKAVTVTATSVADNTKSASATVTVNVTAGILTANPTTISFGSVTVGQTSPILLTTLTNTGNAPLTISSNPMSAGDFGWGEKGTCNYNTLAPGSSCTMSAKFTPTATGTRTGAITISSTASNSNVTIPLSGIGTTATVGTLSVSPATLGMGNVIVGQSGTASGTVTASGASVTVTAASSSNSVFSLGGLSLPVTIPAGKSVPFTITFSPMVSGTANAMLTLTSNANPATTTEGLTGAGTAAATHSVALSWNASTSSGIVGYNVYRAPYTTSCGAYAKLNPALSTGTLYTDSTVANGNNYCYATTAVDSSSRESGYSNVVSNVRVPVL